ncbi:MAG: glucokinase, partial [Alphaproteobacteria bacterium]|nr:glucokinase [Alphaproteobacteria bacterium]
MTAVNPTQPGLIADIGGTNVRFALCTPGSDPYSPMTLHCADHANLVDAARAYLKHAATAVLPKTGAFAVASPVSGDMVTMTNHPWRFSIEATRKELGLDSLRVVNDFVAIALCVPRLTAAHRIRIGAGLPAREAPIGVLGPGTGLGVGLLVPFEGRWHAVPTEGGHVTMPAFDDEESEIISILRRRFGHASAERLRSGPGLVNLYQAIGALDDEEPPPLDPALITERALSGSDRLSVKTLRTFLAMLGT